jgi:hypothetical protein
VTGPAISHFHQVQNIFPQFWYLLLTAVAFVEFISIARVIGLVIFVPGLIAIFV